MTLVTNVNIVIFLPEQCFRAPHNAISATWKPGGAVCGRRAVQIDTHARTHTHQHIPFLLTLKWRLHARLEQDMQTVGLKYWLNWMNPKPWGHKDHTRILRRSHSGVHCKGETRQKKGQKYASYNVCWTLTLLRLPLSCKLKLLKHCSDVWQTVSRCLLFSFKWWNPEFIFSQTLTSLFFSS